MKSFKKAFLKHLTDMTKEIDMGNGFLVPHFYNHGIRFYIIGSIGAYNILYDNSYQRIIIARVLDIKTSYTEELQGEWANGTYYNYDRAEEIPEMLELVIDEIINRIGA